MTRQEIIKFYENKIDDIADEDTREKLLDNLTEDVEIDEELENQEDDYIEDEIGYDYNYFRSVINQ